MLTIEGSLVHRFLMHKNMTRKEMRKMTFVLETDYGPEVVSGVSSLEEAAAEINCSLDNIWSSDIIDDDFGRP